MLLIVGVGLALRLWGIGFGLPYFYNPDEGVPVTAALRMLHTGDLNPGFFHWSSLLLYLNAAAFWLYYVFGALAGRFSSVQDLLMPEMETIAVG